MYIEEMSTFRWGKSKKEDSSQCQVFILGKRKLLDFQVVVASVKVTNSEEYFYIVSLSKNAVRTGGIAQLDFQT